MANRAATLLCVALLVACRPATDRARYQVGEAGLVTFRNELRATLYLGGCSHFDYEKQVGKQWVSQGPDIVCVWEGLAEPVPPDAAVSDPIRAREPGTWRLRYAVGAGCSEKAPLDAGHCAVLGEVASNEFEVLESGCVVSGCSGQICDEAPRASTCEWLPHYACFREASCGRFGPERSCAWEPTPELAACLERSARPVEPILLSR